MNAPTNKYKSYKAVTRQKRGFFSGKKKLLIAVGLIILVSVAAIGVIALNNRNPAVKPPTFSTIQTNTLVASSQCTFSSYWRDDVGLSGFIFSTNNTGTWMNDTRQSLSGTAVWANVTKTLNSNVGVVVAYRWYVVNSKNSWTTTGTKTLTTTASIPTLNAVRIQTVVVSAPNTFSSYWHDDLGLSGFVFSTNNTGTWMNDTQKSLTGTSGWANVTKTLNSNIGAVVGFRWYVVNSRDSWASTEIKTLTTTSGNSTLVRLETSMGDIIIELFDDMPITSGNFKNLTEHGIYDGTIFHRVVVNFVIQGGDATPKGITVPTIPDELPNKHSNIRGSVAMAKTNQLNSATSQFYINLKDNSASLDSNYSVFGRVVAGMDVVDAIAKVQVDSKDKPLQNVTILKAELIVKPT